MVASKTLLVAGDYPLIASPTLAKAFGMATATFLQKLHYCLQKNDVVIYQQRRYWFHSYQQWVETLGFYSISTIKRVISKLKAAGVLIIKKLSAQKWLQTNYYSIDYQKLEQLFVLAQPLMRCKPATTSSVKEVAKMSFPQSKAEIRPVVEKKGDSFALPDYTDQLVLKGTPAPLALPASTEHLNSIPPETRSFYIALRQLKVDIEAQDSRITQWLCHSTAILRHIAYIKQLGQGIERYQWHPPEQLGLDSIKSICTSTRLLNA